MNEWQRTTKLSRWLERKTSYLCFAVATKRSRFFYLLLGYHIYLGDQSSIFTIILSIQQQQTTQQPWPTALLFHSHTNHTIQKAFRELPQRRAESYQPTSRNTRGLSRCFWIFIVLVVIIKDVLSYIVLLFVVFNMEKNRRFQCPPTTGK